MRILVDRRTLHRVLRWGRITLSAVGVSLLAYCGYVAVDAWQFQREGQRQLEQQLASPASITQAPTPMADGVIGRIAVARLGISVVIVEGTGPRALLHAAGHVTGTALPGQVGNIGISAHRDTFFRPLRNIRRDDIIQVTTALGDFRYRVLTTRIVFPDNVAVLDPDAHEILTLVTCYPFYFIGPAPKRFIVRAERVSASS